MKHYGLEVAEGTEITNTTVSTGISFPGDESVGELFFRTDSKTLFVWDGVEWDVASPTNINDKSISELSNVAAMTESEGDLFAYTGGTWNRLAIGTDGQILQVSGSPLGPAWNDAPSGGGGGATGGGSDEVFYENDQNVTTDYTITSGKNAMSAGDITIDSGVTVTVPSGSTWTIV